MRIHVRLLLYVHISNTIPEDRLLVLAHVKVVSFPGSQAINMHLQEVCLMILMIQKPPIASFMYTRCCFYTKTHHC